jgi:biopolymer transport protein ExbD
MAEKKRFLDVWIIESNTVYREVPFTVVSDWVQQGRLLADDMLRPSGTAQWFRLGGMPAFAAYLPKTVPFRVEDKAEALEPVQVDFAWKRRPEDEDEDVDMIPLIDVSLVLLIFFIMISSVAATITGRIRLSQTDAGSKVDPNTLWIGIEQGGDGKLVYTLGDGPSVKDVEPGVRETTDRAVLLRRFDQLLKEKKEKLSGEYRAGIGQQEADVAPDVRIRADKMIVCDEVTELIYQVQLRRPDVGLIHKDIAEPPK